MLGEEQLEPHIAIGDYPAIAVMGVAHRLLDALGDGLVAHLRLQHLILVVHEEVVLDVGLDRLGERFILAHLEEPSDGRGDGFLEHHIGAFPGEEPIGVAFNRLVAILEGKRKGAIDILMRRLLDARPLIVEHQDRCR